MPLSFDDYWRVWGDTPQWLKERGWQHVNDPRDTPASFTWGVPNTTLFEYLAQNTEAGKRFGAMMAVQASGKTLWADEGAYPVKERLGNAQEDEVLVVDLGGGSGHDLLGFKAGYPDLKGRLVLEELPYMINQLAGKVEGIELVEHDFNTPQPIKGTFPLWSWKFILWSLANASDRSACILLPPDHARLLRRDVPTHFAADQACHVGNVENPDQ